MQVVHVLTVAMVMPHVLVMRRLMVGLTLSQRLTQWSKQTQSLSWGKLAVSWLAAGTSKLLHHYLCWRLGCKGFSTPRL